MVIPGLTQSQTEYFYYLLVKIENSSMTEFDDEIFATLLSQIDANSSLPGMEPTDRFLYRIMLLIQDKIDYSTKDSFVDKIIKYNNTGVMEIFLKVFEIESSILMVTLVEFTLSREMLDVIMKNFNSILRYRNDDITGIIYFQQPHLIDYFERNYLR